MGRRNGVGQHETAANLIKIRQVIARELKRNYGAQRNHPRSTETIAV